MCVCETEIQAGRQMERVREGGRVRKKTEGGLFREEDREREKIYIYTLVSFHEEKILLSKLQQKL